MAKAFSFNREFDFVRLARLSLTTGRPAHEWDLYILKELIDNALDADEIRWRNALKQHPILKVRIEYSSNQLFVQVSNRSIFPAKLIPEIFKTRQYASRKAFIKGLTRGALGNALKTLLGIPYALRNRVASDWSPDQKPLSLICNGTEYLPTYLIDTTQQSIEFKCSKRSHRQTNGTTLSIALDYFEQEKPRTLEEIQKLAKQYHLCNPHAHFYWDVEIEDEDWSANYEANLNWDAKFRGTAPIQWYSLTDFQDLLGALYRNRNRQKDKNKLLLRSISFCFSGFNNVDESQKAHSSPLQNSLLEEFGKSSLAVEDFEGEDSKRLYQLMCKLSPPFESLQLGLIGKAHIQNTLTAFFPLDGEVFYDVEEDQGDDPSIPFVIEAAITFLQDGPREIWTAINFSPTYDDPFSRRRLFAPIQPEHEVLGIREFLDAYGIDEDTSVCVFLHLVCPNIELEEFSKTEINHLPFKQNISEVLNRLLQKVDQAQQEQELKLEQAIFQRVAEILDALGNKERFILEQLVEKLRIKLAQEPDFYVWLQTPNISERLQTYINRYENQNLKLIQRVARAATGTLVLPGHPDRHFSIQAEYISQDILDRSHVNKILYVYVPTLEPVIIENGWLCRLDTALLKSASGIDALQSALIQCVICSEVPILFLRNRDAESLAVFEQIQTCLKDQHLDVNRIIDLGLDRVGNLEQVPSRLVEMMPEELYTWVFSQLEALNISAKFIPSNANIRQEVSQRFEQLLLSYLWEGLSRRLKISHFIDNLDWKLQFTQGMQEAIIDQLIQNQLNGPDKYQSYNFVLNKIVEQFFADFLNHNAPNIEELVQTHLQDL